MFSFLGILGSATAAFGNVQAQLRSQKRLASCCFASLFKRHCRDRLSLRHSVSPICSAARMIPTRPFALLAAVLCLCCAAVAHIVANPPEAERNSSVEVSFRVGHGCSTTDPTINFTLTMPEAISSVSVGAVSNWTVSYSFRNATDPSKKQPEWVPSGQEVDTVTWEGYLPPTQFQEFPLRFMTPATGDVLYFPAIQQCANETRNWTDISQSGAAQEPKSPAAALNLTDKKGSSSSAANSVLQFGPLIVAALLSLIALV